MWSRAPAVPFKVMTIARIVYAAAVADKACHLEYELRQLVRQCVENHFNTPRQPDREHARGCLPLGYAPSIRRPVRHIIQVRYPQLGSQFARQLHSAELTFSEGAGSISLFDHLLLTSWGCGSEPAGSNAQLDGFNQFVTVVISVLTKLWVWSGWNIGGHCYIYEESLRIEAWHGPPLRANILTPDANSVGSR